MTARVVINKAKLEAVLHNASISYGDKIAGRIADSARRLAPVDTGRLRASIDVDRRSAIARLTWRIAAHTSYAIFVERGTRYMAAQPYLRPALYSARTAGRKSAGV